MVKEKKRNFEIVAIPNRYKDILDNLINSSDLESPDWSKLIDKKSHNIPKFGGSLIGFLKEEK